MRACCVWLAIAISLLRIGLAPVEAAAAEAASESFDSPRLAALAHDLAASHREMLDEFWVQMTAKTPLV